MTSFNDKPTEQSSMNDWADFWHYYMGANVNPANTREKACYVKWSLHQYKPIPDEVHEERKKNHAYDNGIAVITGPLWRGQFKGKFLLAIDLDNKKAVDELGKDRIEYYKQVTLVEQHANPDKMHIYFIVDRELYDKGRDISKSDKIEANEIPAIEVKATPKHIMYCAFSPHKDGSKYAIVGTLKPQIFKAEEIEELLTSIYSKYGIPYGSGSDTTSSSEISFNDNNALWQSSIQSTRTPLAEPLRQIVNLLYIPENFDYKILEGSRHATMLSLANSILIKHATHKREKLKNFFYEVNNRLCSPPLLDDEIKIIWRDALRFSDDIIKNIQIVGNDQNDPCNYNSQIIVPLEQGDKLLEQETIQNFVYDIRTESISCDFNHKMEPKKIIFRVNLKEWDKARKIFQKLLKEKGLPTEIIQLLLEALDDNYELIKQKYFENKRRQDAITQQRELDRKERLQLQAEATDFLMTTYRFATIEESKDILYYDSSKGVYVYGGEILIEKELDKKYGYRLKTADITEIKNYIMRKTYRAKKEFDRDLDTINIENGLLNIQLGQRTPHTADYLSINQKPIKYNPDAKPVKFLKFLEEVLYPEDIPTALEIIAYTFIRINLFEHWFILIGGGANGKNVFIGIVSQLHGLKNISNVPIIVLGNPHHRFALAQLENKDINVDTELTAKSYNDLSTLKKITGRQPVNLERKGKDPYDAELWAKQLMSCNELPPSNDNTDARYRREIILQFPNQFEEDPKDDPKIKLADPHLLDKIINDPEEMSGILNLVIKSVKSIYDNKKIHVNSTIAERRAKAQLTYDPVQAFLDAGWIRSESDYMLKDDFYGKFVDFCNKNRLHVLSYDLFAKALRKKEYDNGRKSITDNATGEKKKETVWYVKFLKDKEEEQE